MPFLNMLADGRHFFAVLLGKEISSPSTANGQHTFTYSNSIIPEEKITGL
jgi:hypothetical protein